jgi:hypothetical protein
MNIYLNFFLFFSILGYNLFGQNESLPHRVFVELKAGLHRERNLLTDPGGQLWSPSRNEPTTGINIGMLLNNGKSVVGLDYDVVTIGNSFIFRSTTSSYFSGRSFHRLTPNFQYQLPISEKKNYPNLSLVGKIGPTFTFTNSPVGSTGTISTVWLDGNNDSTAFILTQRKLNRNFFAGLTLTGGILFTPNPRLRFSYSLYPSLNFTSNDVIIQDIRYRYFNDPNIYNAQALSTGTTFTHSIAMGYAFGKTKMGKETLARKKQLYTDEEWEKRKGWSLVLHTSNTYPVIHITDAGGHLTNKPVERFTYGAQVFYRLTPKWAVGTGFESVPFQLDARTPSQVGGSGTVVRNSLQFPFLAEYNLLQTKGKVKVEWLARSGLAIGLQRKAIADPEKDFDLRLIQEPEFYWEKETRDRPSTAFLAGLLGTRVNIHVSKNIFFTGYVQNQWAITNNAFHRSRAAYQVGNPQAPLYDAELTTKGSVLLPGFGVGFQL